MKLMLLGLVVAVGQPALWASAPSFKTVPDDGWCRQSDFGDGHWRKHCEVREVTLPISGLIGVDATPNGGISVRGWDQGNVKLQAMVVGASEDGDPAAVAAAVIVETQGTIRATGPASSHHNSWNVSYRLWVPQHSDLALHSMNGGIQIEGVAGRIQFDTMNGGVDLERLAGNVSGRTTNGGLSVRLGGAEWQGEGLSVETTNGGLSIVVPENYNAHLETGTVNGGMTTDIPLTVRGNVGRRLSVDLGHGGATVRAVTTNGGVTISNR